MATATKSQSKTSFVKEFLQDNPQGNVKAVNEAWAAAGMKGTIGATLINKMRSADGTDRQSACEVEAQDSRQGKVSHQNVQAGSSVQARRCLSRSS